MKRAPSPASYATCWLAFSSSLVLLLLVSNNSYEYASAFTTSFASAPAASRRRSFGAAAATAARSRPIEKLRMSAGLPDGVDLDAVTRGLADVRENLASSQSMLPSLSLPRLHIPGILPPSSLDAFPELGLPEWPTALEKLPRSLSGLLSFVDEVRLSCWTPQMSEAWQRVVSGLPFSADGITQASNQAVRALAQASARVSLELDGLVAANPSLGPPLEHLRSSLSHAQAALEQAYAAGAALVPEQFHPLVVAIAIGAASTALGLSLAAAREDVRRRSEASNAPLPREYDLPAIMGYYNRRPLTLLRRLSEVSYRLGTLAAKLWLDKNVGDGGGWERNMQSRAEEFVEFVQGAGPAFIKIGQGVSIRPDILPEAYLKQLVKLQDRVSGLWLWITSVCGTPGLFTV